MPLHDISAYEEQQRHVTAWAAGQFDVVLAFTLTSFFGIEVAERLDLPSIWRVGENESVSTVCDWLGQHLDPAVALRAQRAFAAASVVLCVSESTLRMHRQTGAENFAVLRNGVDVAGAVAYVRTAERRACRESLGIGADRRVLICAGTLWPIKGQALLVSALKHVCAAPAFECVIIGLQLETYTDALLRLIDREGLAGSVRLVPFCEDLRPWWCAADVAVCCSESEALSTSVLEAMAFGLPVLSCRVASMPEVVQEGITGWLCEPSDLGSWVDGLSRVAAAQPAELRRLGEAARSHVAGAHDRRETLGRMTDLLAQAARGSASAWLEQCSQARVAP
jgi:glycosyltransferase involved in cell wall biosynthesis